MLHTPLMWLDKAQTWGLAESWAAGRWSTLIVEESQHLLPRRARAAPSLGLRLRHLPGLPAAGGRLRALHRGPETSTSTARWHAV